MENNGSLGEFINSRADIVKTISSFLKIEKKGANYVTICPFHQDTNPSLSISPSRQIFKCFVCGVGGNSASFVMKYLNINYREALSKVAEINGIIIPKEFNNSFHYEKKEKKAIPLNALEDISNFYQMSLSSKLGKDALNYLKNDRKLDEKTIKQFLIGYAPSNSSLSINVLINKKDYSYDDLIEAGILSKNSSSNNDRYSNRIMFPIKDSNGNICAFSGRKFDKDDNSDSKYINYPETKYFIKGNILYNYDIASKYAKKDKYIYIVEGFMDVIALYRAGINSCIALMGTQLTKNHIVLIKSLKCEVRLCLDSDNAGQSNTISLINLLTENNVNFRIVEKFPDEYGKDADEVINKNGKDILLKLLNRLINPIIYELNNINDSTINKLNSIEQIIDKNSMIFNSLNKIEKSLVIEKIANLTNLSNEAITNMFNASDNEEDDDFIDSNGSFDSGNSFHPYFENDVSRGLKDQKLKKIVYSRLLINETSIISFLPLSRDACIEYEKEKSDNSLEIPILKLLADYIIEKFDEYDVDNLNEEMISEIMDLLIDAKEDETINKIYSISNYDDQTLNNMIGKLMLIVNNKFSMNSFNSELKKHKTILKKMKIEYSSGDNLKEKEEFAKKNTVIKVKKS